MSIEKTCHKLVIEEGTVRANKVFRDQIANLIEKGMKILSISTACENKKVKSVSYELIPQSDPRHGWMEV